MSWHRNAARDPSVGPVELMGREVVRATGYSPLELDRAGIGLPAALRMHLAIEPKRTSALGCNVMQLRLIRERLLDGCYAMGNLGRPQPSVA